MSKHTPGPWDYSWHIQPNGCPTVGHKGLMVCMVAHSAKEPDQKETALANANLIAAAPDLLDTLLMLRDTLPHVGLESATRVEMLRRIDAAIARAKGESQ